MNLLKKIVSSYMLDVENYMSYCKDYGKPNYKYFNFVINKMGLLCIFTSKNEIFKFNSVSYHFVNNVLIEIKNKFLGEESTIRRAALIYLLCKIYFTDETANELKLRITTQEWDVFSSYINVIKTNKAYLAIFIMLNHLTSANFFLFTFKNKILALEFGSPDNPQKSQVDISRDKIFWDDLKQEIEKIDKCDVVELKQLKKIHDEVLKPYQDLVPKSTDFEDALEFFEEVKKLVNEPQSSVPQNMTRREVSDACNSFLRFSPHKTQQQVARSASQIDSEVDEDDDDNINMKGSKREAKKSERKSNKKKEISAKNVIKIVDTKLESMEDDDDDDECLSDNALTQISKSQKSKKEMKKRGRKKNNVVKAASKDITMKDDTTTASSDSDSNFESRRVLLSFNHQSVMKGIGAEKYSDRLKRCYDDD